MNPMIDIDDYAKLIPRDDSAVNVGLLPADGGLAAVLVVNTDTWGDFAVPLSGHHIATIYTVLKHLLALTADEHRAISAELQRFDEDAE